MSPALAGWGLVAGSVVGYDMWALTTGNETMSRLFWRTQSRHPAARIVLTGVWLGLTVHLLLEDRRLLPPRASAAYRRLHPLHRLHDQLVGGN